MHNWFPRHLAGRPDGDLVERERDRLDRFRAGPCKPVARRVVPKHVMTGDSAHAEKGAAVARRQLDALAAIDGDVDQTPYAYGFRDFDVLPPISRSVVQPDSDPTAIELCLPATNALPIDRNCDQVRALIKRLVLDGEKGSRWTLDQFRRALGGGAISSRQMAEFLETRGPYYPIRSDVFQLSWEFFNRRQRLGLPAAAPAPTSDCGAFPVVPVGSKRRATLTVALEEGPRMVKRCREDHLGIQDEPRFAPGWISLDRYTS